MGTADPRRIFQSSQHFLHFYFTNALHALVGHGAGKRDREEPEGGSWGRVDPPPRGRPVRPNPSGFLGSPGGSSRYRAEPSLAPPSPLGPPPPRPPAQPGLGAERARPRAAMGLPRPPLNPRGPAPTGMAERSGGGSRLPAPASRRGGRGGPRLLRAQAGP